MELSALTLTNLLVQSAEHSQQFFEMLGRELQDIPWPSDTAQMRLKLMIMLVFVTSAAYAEDALQSCMDKAMTQPAMNSCAQRELDKTDAELNRLYRELQIRYKDDLAFIKRLRAAQSAWIKFRDAQFEMMFPPHPNEPYYYGSVYPMCSMQYLQQLTSDRTTTLKQWLAGSEGGDVCSGSLKPSSELKRNKKSLLNNGSRR